ncbi:MAG TPA: regulatory protein RecX [Balneolaceae bacterium]|nr:regulatory protein RecX [Balneolaceae bacterium]
MHNRKISEGEPQPADTVKHLLPLEITDLVPQQRNRDRFSLFHKETFLLGVSTDTLTRFQIGRGTICTVQLYGKLLEAEEFHAIRAAALRYLGRRAHSTRELRQKLQRKEFPSENIEIVLDEFTQKEWLSDAKFAEAFAQEKANLNGWGPNKIRGALFQKGVSSEIVENSIENLLNNLDLHQICVDLAMKKRSRFLREKDLQKRNQKIYRYLMSKGYPSQTVTSVLPDILNRLDV